MNQNMTYTDFIDAECDRHLIELKELLCFASVSAQPDHADDLRACASWLVGHMNACGLPTKLHETDGHPIVVGERLDAPGKPTILIYGHYDVQPPEPSDLWDSPPFEPTEHNGNLYARGASDDKGQIFTHIKAMEAWMRTCGHLPVNVKWLIEGEEEVSSTNLEPFIRTHTEQLGCDYVVISDGSQFAPNVPAINYGLRGIAAFEIKVIGAKQDLHSGMFGGAVPNPITILSSLIAGLHDLDGRIAVDSFYDDVAPIQDWERQQFADLPFDETIFKLDLNVPGLCGEAGYSTLERRWTRPTLELNGITGGYQGAGTKTVLPSHASAKVTCRLVPNQDPDRIGELVCNELRRRCPLTVRIEPEYLGGGKPIILDTKSPAIHAAGRAIELGFGRSPVLTREGGSIPVVAMFKELLRADSLLLGWGQPDDNLHAPNEKFSIADFQNGIRAAAALLNELANL